MSVSDYEEILARRPNRFYSSDEVAAIWNDEHPDDPRTSKVIFNALKRRGRPHIIWVVRDKQTQFKIGQEWKQGKCRHCFDPVEGNRNLCRRCG